MPPDRRHISHIAALMPHPETHSEAVEKIEVHVTWRDDGALALTYMLTGDLARLRIPPSMPRRKGTRLWEHTCFEAFVSNPEAPGYEEFNFAPSRQWAAYAFRRYREPVAADDRDVMSDITVSSTGRILELNAAVRPDRLLAADPRVPLRLGLSAVIEESHGALTFWALRHPPGKPDFHDVHGFALEITWPGYCAKDQAKAPKR